ncbi:phospholipid carrier-dependent glycosyltransferase [Candidatus Sumerlaeota bacterium]|nr:phospholipid carrier-dependent glycosyltransferase [Candidatus Sumerlaeota bacterium]
MVITREMILPVTIAAGIGCVVCAIVNMRAAATDAPEEGPRWLSRLSRHFPHAIWALAVLKIGLMLTASMSGYVTQWQDDACRFMMTTDFMSDFKLGPQDHIWPGGPFMLGALAMKLANDPVTAIRWLAITFSAMSVLAMGWLVRRITGSAFGAVLAVAVIAVLPMHTWLAGGAMTEVPMACFLLLSLACFFRARRFEFQSGEPNDFFARRVPWWNAAAGLCATGAASYRYEGWMFILALLAVAWCSALLKVGKGRAHLAGAVALTASSLLFPVLWIIDSWRVLGSPTAFFRSQVGMNTVGVSDPLWDRLMLFPIGMNNQIKALWGLILSGIVCAAIRWRGRREQAAFAAIVLLYFAILVAMVVVKGMGVSLERYVISIIVVAIPFIGIAAGEAMTTFELAGNRIARLAIGVYAVAAFSILLFVLASVSEINRYKWWGFRNETFVAGSLLQQEFHEAQLLPGIAKGGRVVVQQFDHEEGLAHHWQIALMAGNYPSRVLFTDQEILEEKIALEPDLTVMQFHGDDGKQFPDMKKVMELGTLKVFHRFPEGN